ncbi:hypothetical protein WICANDRAFT_59941 [Wickerhamomyces anomalus NRRL Y-366-8]|uniref:Non-specific serine/threonine protein kinase n=1 Tax=Wickerhamomyces anomalus (strain ATCC 58044 / CBS 1984 / NCYC 433 / NRRL Y-366-8) TaxID=683960 RepID=A0A1E3P8X8_WICAA|nr:uncharacterized protein WICANDRAFT_59941 [Wickerhamomyces anomalus NRRL Y-366-8]ODQ61865.1 hypothetical protein WICANDRAFT_59941 [Wickerhamomyces anomalus NRRL Y-366-8]
MSTIRNTSTGDAADVATGEEAQVQEVSGNSSQNSNAGEQFIARIPINFNEYRVIQDIEAHLTRVIKITTKGLQQYFIKPGCFHDYESHHSSDYIVVLKLYSFNHLENYFWNFFDNYMDETLDEFSDNIIKGKYETEVEINKIINDFNDTVDDPSKMINSPRMLAFGRMTSTSVLTPFDGYYIAFQEVKVGNNKFNGNHIKGLIDEVQKFHSIKIAHGDLAIRNILVDEQDEVHLIDYNSL